MCLVEKSELPNCFHVVAQERLSQYVCQIEAKLLSELILHKTPQERGKRTSLHINCDPGYNHLSNKLSQLDLL